MAALGGVFDATQVEPQGEYTPIPAGEYKVQIITSEMVANKAETGQMLKLELEIMEGQQSGRKIFDRLNLDNPNMTAVEIAQRQLSAICHAVGQLSVQDSEQLHFKPMIAAIVVTPPKGEYGAGNNIKTYKPIGSAPAASGFAPAARQATAPAGDAPWKRAAA
jgi:hypothetical protein